MNDIARPALNAPRFVDGKEMHIAGIGQRYVSVATAGIAAQWQAFALQMGGVPGRIGNAAYGVCRMSDGGGFEYICGVEVADFSAVPQTWSRINLPATRYAVFVHRGPVSSIRATFESIWRDWLPTSGFQVADAPLLERYGEDFDSASATGNVEIWVPLV